MTRYIPFYAGVVLALCAALGASSLCALASEPTGGTEPIATPQERTVTIAEGLSDEDAAAVAEGKTVRIIDQYFDNFADAVEVANQNGGGTVVLLADTVATDDIKKTATIGFRTSIIIKSEGDVPLTVYRAHGQTGPMLQMTDGTVSLKNVTFDGSGEGVGSPAITISDQAVVKLGKGFTVCNNVSDGSTSGKLVASAVSISGKDASLTLKKDCVIKDNTGNGPVEAAIYNSGATVVNEGATFEGNAAENGESHDYAGTGKLKGEKI